MRTESLVSHFGSKIAVARALGITKAAVSNWGELVPEGTAYKAQVVTGGALQVNPDHYTNSGRRRRRKARR